MKTRPHKTDDWKVEPLPATRSMSAADPSTAELVALLAAAYRRINVLETELGKLAA